MRHSGRVLWWGVLSLFVLRLSLCGVARAADKPRVLWTVQGDTVSFWLAEAPGRGWGFFVDRKVAGEADFVRLTERPVRPARGPAQVQAILGSAYPRIADLLEADDAVQVLRRLRSDAFRAGVLSLLEPRVARALGRFFADTSATGAGPFVYRFVFVDRRGREGDRFQVTVSKQERLPGPPLNLKAEPGDARVTLVWSYPLWKGDPTDLAIQFRVLRKRKGEQTFRPLDHKVLLREQQEEFRYTDLWLRNGEPVSYVVVAVDPLGREGPRSNAVTVTPVDKVPPAPPKGVVALADTATVRLSWALSPELDVASYRVYRSLSPRDKPEQISGDIPADEPFFVDRQVRKAQTFFYRVSAVDSSGNESELSNAVSARVSDAEPPLPPGGVQVSASSQGLRVRWQPSPSQDVAGYHVFRGTDPERLGRATHELLPSNAKEFAEGPEYLIPGAPLWVSVVAVDKAGNKSLSKPVQVNVPDWRAPKAPVSLTVRTVDGRRVLVSWGASPSLDVKAYRVYRATGGGPDSLLAELAASAREYVDGGVTKGAKLIYRVTAVDPKGNESKPRERALVVKDHVPPPSPRDLAARLLDSGVEVTWGRVIAKDLAGYYVYRSKLPTGVFEKLNSVPLKERRFVDPAGEAGHWYKVRAVDTSGNESAWKSAVRPK